MSPSHRQTALINRFSIIPDIHERLAAITSRKPSLLPFRPEERSDACRVRGCQSRVWLVSSCESGRCRFRFDAESAMVRGLVGVICEIYDNGTPEEIVATEPKVFEALGIEPHLSPTRLNGIASVRTQIREFAASCLAQ